MQKYKKISLAIIFDLYYWHKTNIFTFEKDVKYIVSKNIYRITVYIKNDKKMRNFHL